MLTKRWFIFLVLPLIVFNGVVTIYGKGSPDRILVSREASVPLEISDRETLKKFDPWRGQFIDWTKGVVSPPAGQDQKFEVFFYMKWPGRHSDYDRGDLKLIYTASYVPGGEGLPGFVYLPGKGEKFHDNNAGTIWREQDDGKWHQASAEWDALVRHLLASRQQTQESFLSSKALSCAFWAVRTAWEFGV